MSETSENQEAPKSAELNLDNLEPWLGENITDPFIDFVDKKNPNGSPFTREQATEASKEQLRLLARDREGMLGYLNKSRIKKNLEPMSMEEYEKDMKENFQFIAEEIRNEKLTSTHK